MKIKNLISKLLILFLLLSPSLASAGFFGGTSASSFPLTADVDFGDYDVKSIDGLYGVDDDIYVDMGADGILALVSDTSVTVSSANWDVDSSGNFSGVGTFGSGAITTTGQLNISTTDADGIVFGSLGTATKAIDFSSSGLAGSDNWFYGSASNYWNAGGTVNAANFQGGNFLLSSGKMIYSDASTNLNIYADSTRTIFLGNVNNGASVGSFSSCTVGAAAAIIQHADIDTNTAVGDVVHVTSGTGVTAGFYRITVVGGNQVTVNRNVSGAGGSNIACIVHKDVIGIFATDGTNGQRIMGYSHQDKPLQIGGDVLVATVNLGSEDVLIGNLLGLPNATAEPGGAFTGGTILYSKDSSDGATNATLGIYTEQAVEADAGGITASHKLQIWINGVEYYIELDAV